MNLLENEGEFRAYTFLREERYQFQGLRNENYVEAELKVTLLKVKEDNQPIFRIEMPIYKQSNSEGAYRWVGDLHELRERLICTLNTDGQLGEILNLEEIQEKWNEIKPKVAKNHQDEKYKAIFIKGIDDLLQNGQQLADTLRYAMPYQLLFPGIHTKNFKKNEAVKGFREIPNFIATKSIPVITNESIKDLENGKYQIDVKGIIDEEKFEQDKVTAMIRILKNRPRVPTLVELNYIERYLLEEWPWSEQSMCMSLIQIPGTLYREEKNILKAISHDISVN